MGDKTDFFHDSYSTPENIKQRHNFDERHKITRDRLRLKGMIVHDYNSVRFRCKTCGRLHHWNSNITHAYDAYFEILCPCGELHYKDRCNFRGEGPVNRR